MVASKSLMVLNGRFIRKNRGKSLSTLFAIQFPLDGIPFTLPSVVSPSWDQLAPPSVVPFAGPDDALSPLRWMSTHLHRCRTTQGSLTDDFYFVSLFSTLHETTFLCFYEQNDHLTPLAIWKLPTNHHGVVASLLLDADCPVLLTRGGIP